MGENEEQIGLKISSSYSLIANNLSIKVRTAKTLNHLKFQQIVSSGYLILAQVLKVQAIGKSHFFSLLPKPFFEGRGMSNMTKQKKIPQPNSLKERINKIIACIDKAGELLQGKLYHQLYYKILSLCSFTFTSI